MGIWKKGEMPSDDPKRFVTRRLEFRNVQQTRPGLGNPKSKLPNKRELVGYVPMAKRVAALIAAGLNTAASKDMMYYDSIGEDVQDIQAPPLPRHVPADMAEVSEMARAYKARRVEIEERVRKAREKRAQDLREAAAKPAGGTPPVGSGEGSQPSPSGSGAR